MSTMLPHRVSGALLVFVMASSVQAHDGLRVPDNTVPPAVAGWHARLGVTAPLGNTGAAEFPRAQASALPTAQLFGDYYFTGPGFGGGRVLGGLRATSGLLVGARGAGFAPPIAGTGLSVNTRRSDAMGEPLATQPYVGVGYTGQSLRGGWAFSADLGLLGTPRTPGLQWQGQGASLDDVVRDLRLTPSVHLGVSYSF